MANIELKPLTKDRFNNLVVSAVTDAENFKEQEVAPERLKSWMYWNGRTDLPAQPNRSKVVMTEVSDTVEQTVPQLMDMFTAGEEPVVFTSEQNQQFAAQATKLASYLFWCRNNGWTLMEDFIRDALIAKTGVFKVSMRPKQCVAEETYSGQSPDEFALLVSDDSVEVLEYEEMPDGIACRIRVTKNKPEYYVDCIAPEDFLINRAATSTTKTEYRLIGERRLMMVSDVVEMGIPFETAIKYAGYEGSTYEEQEREQRNYRNIYRSDHAHEDPSLRTIVVYEIYVRADKDGDGVAELRKVLAIGDKAAYIHNDEVVKDHPYAVGSPVRIPHAVIGKSQADFTRDLQDITTQLTRQMLDNAVHHNNPRTWYLKGQTDMRELKDNRFNGLLGVRQQGAVGHLQIPFIGDKVLALNEYMDQRKEQRTGISKDSMALNAEALQSSTETGVRAVIGASQTHIKMIARSLCETGLKECFRKLIDLAVEHQDEEMQVLVSGAPITMDPRTWKTVDMTTQANVGIGNGTREEKIGALMQVAAEQKAILTEFGPMNPIVTTAMYGATLHKLSYLAGCGPSEQYWKPVATMDQEAQAMAQQAAQQDSGQAQMQAMMQIEMAKIQAKAQADQAKLAADTQLKQQRMSAEMELKVMEVQMDAQIDVMKAELDARNDMDQAAIDAAIDEQKARNSAQLKAAELAIEARLEKYRIDNDPNQGQANLRQVN